MPLLTPGLDWLRSARWLTPERARIYARMIAVAMALAAVGQFGQILHSTRADPQGRPMATDFNAFWSAARLAREGHAPAAYEPAPIAAAEQAGAQPSGLSYYPFLYPPTFLLLLLPLGALGYLPALAVFEGLGYFAWASLSRRLLPRSWPASLVWAMPAAMMNATLGQSAFIPALGFTGAALWLETRPFFAGICLTLVSAKPHFALVVPVALVAAARWRCLAAFAGGGALWLGASCLTVGQACWTEFLHALPITRAVLLSDDIWPKLLSVYAGVRLLHGSAALAGAGQAVCAALVLVLLWRTARRRPSGLTEMAMVVPVSLLFTPYLFDYDLVCTAVPMAFIAGCAMARGWRPWEKILLPVLGVYPLIARFVNLGIHIPAGPLLIAALLCMVVRRSSEGAAMQFDECA